jgi:2-haloacid dehalogenase
LRASGIGWSSAVLHEYRQINEALWERYRRREIAQAELAVERFRQLLARLGAPVRDARRLDRLFIESLSQHGDLLPGCRALLRSLAGSYRLAIVTNGIDRVQRSRLRAAGLERFFAAIVTSEGCGFAKPDPRILHVALQALSVEAREAVYVGDDARVDGEAARAAGVSFIWMDRGAPLPRATRRPRRRIVGLGELLEVL